MGEGVGPRCMLLAQLLPYILLCYNTSMLNNPGTCINQLGGGVFSKQAIRTFLSHLLAYIESLFLNKTYI